VKPAPAVSYIYQTVTVSCTPQCQQMGTGPSRHKRPYAALLTVQSARPGTLRSETPHLLVQLKQDDTPARSASPCTVSTVRGRMVQQHKMKLFLFLGRSWKRQLTALPYEYGVLGTVLIWDT